MRKMHKAKIAVKTTKTAEELAKENEALKAELAKVRVKTTAPVTYTLVGSDGSKLELDDLGASAGGTYRVYGKLSMKGKISKFGKFYIPE